MTMAAAGVAKLIEECGELQQVLGKKLAWWDTDQPHWDGSILRDRMADEMGDVLAAIWFVADQLGLDKVKIGARQSAKTMLFGDWQDQLDNNDHGVDGTPRPWVQAETVRHAMNSGVMVTFDDPQPDEESGEVQVCYGNGARVVFPAKRKVLPW